MNCFPESLGASLAHAFSLDQRRLQPPTTDKNRRDNRREEIMSRDTFDRRTVLTGTTALGAARAEHRWRAHIQTLGTIVFYALYS